MKVAVLRYSLNLQTEADSSVGGGRLTRAVLESIQRLGHDVVVVGKAGKQTQPWLAANGFGYEPSTASLRGYGAAVVLTGPRNSLYGASLVNTYKLLGSLPNGAKAAYAQWDVALPFAFKPEFDGGLAKHGLHSEQIKYLDWTLLTQLSETATRSKGGRPIAYDVTPFKHSRCFFELEEFAPDAALPVCSKPNQAFAYFGSDRPGRLREFRRWFHAPGAPKVHVYGRWSEASMKECAAPNVEFRPHVAEGSVRQCLNEYMATLYMADPAYVKADFVAQRFFENAMAGVVTLYSDRLQPSIAQVVTDGLKLQDPKQLGAWQGMLAEQSPVERRYLVACNRAAAQSLADATQERRLASRLQEFLS